MPEPRSEALVAIDAHIMLIKRRLLECAMHRGYLKQIGRSLDVSHRTQARLEAELAALREERRFAAHRARFRNG